MDVTVKLEIFEGPLDLLLHLIRKEEVDIHDIPVALITRQYLEYLDLLRDMNISVAGEFLVMAATLTQIKSRMLLPCLEAPAGEEGETDDPRLDLVAQLQEHLRFKAVAEELSRRPMLGHDIFPRGVSAQALDADQEPVLKVGVFDLVSAFQRMLQKRSQRLDLPLPAARITLEERMSQVLALLREAGNLLFEDLFRDDQTREQLVVTFLSILELTRLGLLKAYQERLPESSATGPAVVIWGPLRVYFNLDDTEEEDSAEAEISS